MRVTVTQDNLTKRVNAVAFSATDFQDQRLLTRLAGCVAAEEVVMHLVVGKRRIGSITIGKVQFEKQ